MTPDELAIDLRQRGGGGGQASLLRFGWPSLH